MSLINWLDREGVPGQAKTTKLLKERYRASELICAAPVWTH